MILDSCLTCKNLTCIALSPHATLGIMKRFLQFALLALLATAGLLLFVPAIHAANCFVYTDGVGHVCIAEATEPAFVEPEPFADSILPRRNYARLDDLINVYAAPSGAAPVRSVPM